jgi:hypothetical protein
LLCTWCGRVVVAGSSPALLFALPWGSADDADAVVVLRRVLVSVLLVSQVCLLSAGDLRRVGGAGRGPLLWEAACLPRGQCAGALRVLVRPCSLLPCALPPLRLVWWCADPLMCDRCLLRPDGCAPAHLYDLFKRPSAPPPSSSSASTPPSPCRFAVQNGVLGSTRSESLCRGRKGFPCAAHTVATRLSVLRRPSCRCPCSRRAFP